MNLQLGIALIGIVLATVVALKAPKPSGTFKPIRLMTGALLTVATIGVGWGILAGMHGYTLGNPPTGLDAVTSCYRTQRIAFLIPAWKPAPAIDCQGGIMNSAPSNTTGSNQPAAPICDDPNAATDGNASGEMTCP